MSMIPLDPKRRRAPPQACRPPLQAPGDGCSFHIADGLLHVTPYIFQYASFAKTRWLGRSVLDVLTKEFSLAHSGDPVAFYEKAIEEGRVLVNREKTQPQHKIKPHDLITHLVHRHEPPVLSSPLEILGETADLLAVCKPGSIPIHNCGKFHHLSVQGILFQQGYHKLYGFHRLDRLTSGLIIFAKRPSVAASLSRQIRQFEMEKIYLARVIGEFPADSENEPILVEAPIVCASKRDSNHLVREDGKAARTLFRRISFNGHSSLVECRPLTGKTHQIRIHLQHIGHGIVNDLVYGGSLYSTNAIRPEKHPQPGEPVENCEDCKGDSFYQGKTMHPSHIWLHAFKYSAKRQENSPPGFVEFSFQTSLPDWARANFDSRAACENPIDKALIPPKRAFRPYDKEEEELE